MNKYIVYSQFIKECWIMDSDPSLNTPERKKRKSELYKLKKIKQLKQNGNKNIDSKEC